MTFTRIGKLAFAGKLRLNLSSSESLENVPTLPLYKIKQNVGKKSWPMTLKTTNCTTLELERTLGASTWNSGFRDEETRERNSPRERKWHISGPTAYS